MGKRGVKTPRIGGNRIDCRMNEQICLNSLQPRAEFQSKAIVKSGKIYNRGGCVLAKCGDGAGDPDRVMHRLGLKDPKLEVMHFVGSSKFIAQKALCDGDVDLTGEGQNGYGCGV